MVWTPWLLVTGGCVEADGGKSEDSAALDDADTAVDPAWHRDADGDRYGDPADVQHASEAPSGFVDDGSDCDDADPAVFPGASEVCNDRDDDEVPPMTGSGSTA